MQALHVFKYLEIYIANDIAFKPCYKRDTSDKNIQSNVQAMGYLYADAGEEIPPNTSNPRGKPVQVNLFIKSYNAGDRATQRSQAGNIFYIVIQH